MYERLLEKSIVPTREFMTDYCGVNKESFIKLNKYMTDKLGTNEP